MLATHRISQGSQAIFKVPLLIDGVATAVAGWSLVAVVRQYEDSAALITCTAANGRVAPFGDDAWLVTIEAADSAAITPGRYFLAYQGTGPDGKLEQLEICHLYIDPSFFN